MTCYTHIIVLLTGITPACDLLTLARTLVKFFMSIISLNANGISSKKLQSLVKKAPSNVFAICCQEPKCLFPPRIDGFSCHHNLGSSQHGAIMYIRSCAYNVEVIHASHNVICCSFNIEHDKKIICTSYYNPWSSRSNWKLIFEPLLEKILKLNNIDRLLHICAGDLNFQPCDAEFTKISNFLATANLFPKSTLKATFKNLSFLDHVFLSENISNYRLDVGTAIPKCDHLPLILKTNFYKPRTLEKNLFTYIDVNTLKNFEITNRLKRIDIKKILSQAHNCNDFFIALDSAISLAFSDRIFHTDSSSAKIDKFCKKNLNKSLPKILARPQVLAEVSKMTSQPCPEPNIEIAARTLNTAEFFPVDYNYDSSYTNNFPAAGVNFNQTDIRDVLKSLKNGKSSGLSLASGKILKALPDSWTSILSIVFTSISKSNLPVIFRFKKCVTIPKKGDGVRPICITMLIAKIYEKALASKLLNASEKYIPINQSAYLPKRRGCEENIYTTRIICDLFREVNLLLFDFKQAFSTITNKTIFLALNDLNIDSGLKFAIFEAIKYFIIPDFKNHVCHIYSRGVPQGHPCSGLLFILSIRSLCLGLNNLKLSKPIRLGNNFHKILLNNLFFADDLLCFARNHNDAVTIINFVTEWSKTHGLPLNIKKSFSIGNLESLPHLTRTDSTDYLGITIHYCSSSQSYSFKRDSKSNLIASKISNGIR